LLAAFQFAICDVCAETFYISSSQGQDDSNGLSEETPWKTIGRVNQQVFGPGDRISFRSGDQWEEGLHIQSSGKFNSPIIFSSYGEGRLPKISSNVHAAIIENSSFIVIGNLEFLGSEGSAVFLTASVPQEGIVIQNCKIHSCGLAAIQWSRNSSARISASILNNKLWDTSPGVGGGIEAGGAGIAGDILIEKNEIFNTDHGIWIRDAQSVIIRYNYSHDNRDDFIYLYDCYGAEIYYNISSGDGDDGIDLKNSDNSLIHNNVIMFASDAGLNFKPNTSGCWVVNNILYMNRRGTGQTNNDTDILVGAPNNLDYNLYYSDVPTYIIRMSQ
jgi:parallel beta-helix repeat protein